MTYDEALRKALACLKLANNNANEHEAALAASKAQKLIDDYKLDMAALDLNNGDGGKDEPVAEFNDDPLDKDLGGATARWAINLGSTVARLNGCRITISRWYDSNSQSKTKLFILGRPSDVNAVRYFYSYLKGEVLRLATLNTKGNSGTYRRHYCLGVVDTIGIRLRKQQKAGFEERRQEVGANSMALMRINNAIAKVEQRGGAVDKYMEDLTAQGRLGKGRCANETGSYTGGRAAGQRDGHQVRLTSAKGSLTAGHKAIRN